MDLSRPPCVKGLVALALGSPWYEQCGSRCAPLAVLLPAAGRSPLRREGSGTGPLGKEGRAPSHGSLKGSHYLPDFI